MTTDMFKKFLAFRWDSASGDIVPAKSFRKIDVELIGIEKQRDLVTKNLEAFVSGKPASNALLWGAKGCGKSSLIHEMIHKFFPFGMKTVEVPHPFEILELCEKIYDIPYRFMLFMDDLGIDDPVSYRQFKRSLDGGLSMLPENTIIVATANRRHLIAEIGDNTDLHPDESTNELLSVSTRFGLVIPFYPITKDQYISIIKQYFKKLGINWKSSFEKNAERWAISRGGRSGRLAMQFSVSCSNGIIY